MQLTEVAPPHDASLRLLLLRPRTLALLQSC
jgi:hypothetical protein